MRFRPCIDLHKGKVKQIIGGTLSDNDTGGLVTNFETDARPSTFARMFRRDRLTGGHVIMLGGGNEDAARDALAAFPGGLQVGGGITAENAPDFLAAGASHVIVTSFIFRNGAVDWDRLAELSQTVGKERLVIDLSCRKRDGTYWVVTDRWQHFTSTSVGAESLKALARWCDEFLVHAADIEGRQEGIDGELVGLLGAHAPIPATYAGGVRTLDDLEEVRMRGAGRVDVTVGSALDIYGGQLKYGDVVAWHEQLQTKGGA